MARNRHAAATAAAARGGALPRQLRSGQTCSRCYHAAECMLAHAAKEGGTAESSGTEELFTAKTGHLSARHLAYYAAWERMIDLEAKAGGDLVRRRMWLQGGAAREAATGLCMGNMRYVGEEQAAPVGTSGASHVHTFCRAASSSGSSGSSTGAMQLLQHQERALTELGLSEGDRVIVSTEGCVGSAPATSTAAASSSSCASGAAAAAVSTAASASVAVHFCLG
jgi:hypothetical protein